jgi:hypothetical protein
MGDSSTSLGKDADVAVIKMLRMQNRLEAVALGVKVFFDGDGDRLTLDRAKERFLTEKAAHRADKTLQEFTYVLPQFIAAIGKRYIEEITSDDLLEFITHLRGLGLADRTVANKVARIECFLRRFGIVDLLTRYDRPRYVEKVARAYVTVEIQKHLLRTKSGCSRTSLLVPALVRGRLPQPAGETSTSSGKLSRCKRSRNTNSNPRITRRGLCRFQMG